MKIIQRKTKPKLFDKGIKKDILFKACLCILSIIGWEIGKLLF